VQRVAGIRGSRAEGEQELQTHQSQQDRQGGPAGPEPARWTALKIQGVCTCRPLMRGEGLPGQGWRSMGQGGRRSWTTR
jgi:hypothetical protein